MHFSQFFIFCDLVSSDYSKKINHPFCLFILGDIKGVLQYLKTCFYLKEL